MYDTYKLTSIYHNFLPFFHVLKSKNSKDFVDRIDPFKFYTIFTCFSFCRIHCMKVDFKNLDKKEISSNDYFEIIFFFKFDKKKVFFRNPLIKRNRKSIKF